MTYDNGMANPSKFTYFRRKYLRPIYLPFFSIIHRNYLFGTQMILARKVTKSFNFTIKKQPNSTVIIKYDHSSSPPTYGDYFVILMIARFVSMSGHKVRFEIIDLIRSGNVWNALNTDTQDLLVLDQIKLAQEFLTEDCQIVIYGKFTNESTYSPKKNLSSIMDEIEIYSNSFYQWAPYFLHLLIAKHEWPIPTGFLLEAKSKRPEFRFVAWNVRKSIWANYRDTHLSSLMRDFAEIRELFPAHSIMILSNKEGIDFAVTELKMSDPTFGELLAQGIVLTQPNDGFRGGIDWILHSDFYFQRSGGGMGIAAIFSSIPYVQYSIEKTSFFGHHRNRKITPWSAEDQIFKRLFIKKRTLPFSKNII